MLYSYEQCEASLPCVFSGFPQHMYCRRKRPHAFFRREYLFTTGDLVSKDVLKSFHNLLLQVGDGTSTKKLDEDFDILLASEGGNVDLLKWSKDDFNTGLIPDYINCKYFAGKLVATNNFGLCFAANEKFYQHFLATTFFHLGTEKRFWSPVGACQKQINFGPCRYISVIKYPVRQSRKRRKSLPCKLDIYQGQKLRIMQLG